MSALFDVLRGQFLCVLLLSLLWCAQTDDMTESASAYFAEGQKSLASSCDIVLVLDDGVRLPAHSHVLARLLSLFSDMLDEGPLCRASRDSPVEVPLSECSTNEAIHFLSVLYPVNGSKSRGAPHLSTARLAHKYGTQAVVATCDDALSELAGFQCQHPTYLKALQEEAFLEILDGACDSTCPCKLLACCAHSIAVDFSDQSGLWLPSLLEEHLPLSGAVRIAAAWRELIRRSVVLCSHSHYMSGPISFLRPER